MEKITRGRMSPLDPQKARRRDCASRPSASRRWRRRSTLTSRSSPIKWRQDAGAGDGDQHQPDQHAGPVSSDRYRMNCDAEDGTPTDHRLGAVENAISQADSKGVREAIPKHKDRLETLEKTDGQGQHRPGAVIVKPTPPLAEAQAENRVRQPTVMSVRHGRPDPRHRHRSNDSKLDRMIHRRWPGRRRDRRRRGRRRRHAGVGLALATPGITTAS